ncbi:hypothetical protein JZ751_018873 [Albula glossodonta]|uniref:Uncharacterized protein n=1 Tax=Albula glossodonta TaxID=121402 RepID=A0A8T2MUX8_9TELE|nr:hypothetical protein JZ751_018873 [Albula glossodonta]
MGKERGGLGWIHLFGLPGHLDTDPFRSRFERPDFTQRSPRHSSHNSGSFCFQIPVSDNMGLIVV